MWEVRSPTYKILQLSGEVIKKELFVCQHSSVKVYLSFIVQSLKLKIFAVFPEGCQALQEEPTADDAKSQLIFYKLKTWIILFVYSKLFSLVRLSLKFVEIKWDLKILAVTTIIYNPPVYRIKSAIRPHIKSGISHLLKIWYNFH